MKLKTTCKCGFEYVWESTEKPPASFKCERCGSKLSYGEEPSGKLMKEVKGKPLKEKVVKKQKKQPRRNQRRGRMT